MPVELKNVLKVDDPSGFTYYLGSLTPNHIKELTFVPVVTKSPQAGTSLALNERDEQGYQRAGDPARMEKIRAFVLNAPDCVIPPVLLSARGKWHFTPSSASKYFGALVAEDLAAIIDGQHRLGGLWKLVNDPEATSQLKERPIPFMLIEDMNIDKEQGNFIDINDNQQGVKKSLIKYLTRSQTFVGQAALALMEEEDSVFAGRITIQRKEDWSLILFGAAEECVALMFDSAFTTTTGFKPDATPENRTKAITLLLDYWRSVSKCFSEFWSDMDRMPPVHGPRTDTHPGTRSFEFRVLEETGIRAISKLGSFIFRQTWVPASSSPAWDQIETLLTQLSQEPKVRLALTKPTKNPAVLEMDPFLKSSGKAGVTAIYTQLETALIRL